MRENEFSQLYRKKPALNEGPPAKREESKMAAPQSQSQMPRPTATFGGPIDFSALSNQIKPSSMMQAQAMPARGGENRPQMSSAMPSRGVGGDMSLKAPKS